MDDNTTDRVGALIARVELRDRQAYRALYVHTSAKLLGICLRILSDKAEAEDALQETFIKIWQKASSYDANTARGMTWMASIARNQCIDRLRARRKPDNNAELPDDIEDEAPGPAQSVAAARDFERIKACLRELDPKYRQAVETIHLTGMTYQQAAETLKTPANTIKTWVRRSLVVLRECLNR